VEMTRRIDVMDGTYKKLQTALDELTLVLGRNDNIIENSSERERFNKYVDDARINTMNAIGICMKQQWEYLKYDCD
jgi:hypothetical protein